MLVAALLAAEDAALLAAEDAALLAAEEAALLAADVAELAAEVASLVAAADEDVVDEVPLPEFELHAARMGSALAPTMPAPMNRRMCRRESPFVG
jgi:hypothetical protein